ncbi:hypothetical protein K435DRAFT_808453 [Dendrothele bispora CBS 962.96]|uniref:Uncharacterized protein n=1 Tax=Dendrothele bispora (strain CBS 962.96) TaxID=1314807 RepID=A0A4S8L1E2_DENBC|nr:hypothetical protein K435DRAFT_808453 [Dendrothele bispora CBS 962.96]
MTPMHASIGIRYLQATPFYLTLIKYIVDVDVTVDSTKKNMTQIRSRSGDRHQESHPSQWPERHSLPNSENSVLVQMNGRANVYVACRLVISELNHSVCFAHWSLGPRNVTENQSINTNNFSVGDPGFSEVSLIRVMIFLKAKLTDTWTYYFYASPRLKKRVLEALLVYLYQSLPLSDSHKGEAL